MFALIAGALGIGSAKAAAISAGAGLIGGHLSRQTAKKERANHFANLRYSAERGGFHPLTVLRATGGGGYGQYAAELSRSPIESAIRDGAQAFQQYNRDSRTMAHETNLQTMRQSHEMKLSRAQTDAFNSRVDDMTSVTAFGMDTVPSPHFSDAELIEQRYGDVASWFYGLGVVGADATLTGTKYLNKASDYLTPYLTRAGNAWPKPDTSGMPTKNGIPQVQGFTWPSTKMPPGWNFRDALTRRNGMTWVAPRNPNSLKIEVPLGN